jgi:N-acetylmuramoyl-L-alanine amidase
MPSRLPLRDAPGTREPAPGVSWLNRDGFAWTGRESSGTPSAPRLPGYRSWAGSDDTLRLVAVAGGALHRRRLALDPDGGGSDTTGMGPGGTRAAIVNLQVARALAALLEAAGAEVVLVRDRDEAVPEPERVRRSEAFGAERYLRIGRRAETPHLGYFFSSAGGRAWAERTAAVLASLGLPRPALREDAQYPLQQTSCPALYAGLGRIDDPGDEERVHAPGVLRAEAYALYLGLAGEFAPAAAWPVDSLELRDPEGRPASGQYVTLGRSLVLESDALGRIRFARTESGPLEADWEATGTRRALLDSERGCLMTGPHGR